MAGRTTSERKDLRRIVAITLAALTLVIAGAAGLMTYAAAGIDRVQAEKERQLAQVRLDRTLEGLIENINSSAIWNDSVISLAGRPDLEWLQINFGDYYADFMGHAVTLVYDRHGDLILTSRDSEPVDPASERAFIDAVAPLVAEVRRQAAAKHDRPRVSFDASVNQTALVSAGADIYLVGLGTVVREDLTQPRLDNDPVIVSAKPVSEFLGALEKDLAIVSPTLTEAGPSRDNQGYLVLEGPGDVVLGQVRWTPDRPGFSVLKGAAPAVGGLILLLAAAAMALFLRVRGIVRRLEENELDLTEARDRAEGANIAKTRFLGVMSHELRTPLNGVLGMAEILAMGDLDAKQRSQLGVLKQSGESLLALIERILTVARLEKGELVPDPVGVDAADLIHSLAVAHRPTAERAGLTLVAAADDSIEGLWRLDGDYLRQALGHLLDNALRHTSRGSVKLEARAIGSELEFRVADTGAGIAPSRLPDLFGKFVQADDSATRAKEGAGVGLTLARGLIEAMGGSVRAMSTPGMGSIFTIHLPAERVGTAAAAPAERQAA
ncbi:ATP-binding protein [Brevundimonas sp.]|uniref:sensor histidine kinase n=1 Tax=Brevundimonas sp. TaxID=1871086 RepID=UPI002737D412|nr:ATP-binding protein [Brevundimonas sp.]MDP3802442.1 ATP-binding protein [Brevundimonas sp.]